MPIKDSISKSIEKVSAEEEKREQAKEHLKDKKLGTAWKAAPIVSNVADAVSTELMRRKLGDDFKEVNPLGRGIVKKPALSIAAKAALGVGASYIADKFAKKYGKTAGKIIAGVGSAAPTYATISNTSKTLKKRTGSK